MKKHIKDFTPIEKTMVIEQLQRVKSQEKCQHCIDRMWEKRISSEEMIRVFQEFDIIEYHQRYSSHRVLIRGKTNERGRNICLVVDLETGNIVTTYANKVDDHHFTLRQEEYDARIDLEKILRQRGLRCP